jgi:dTDP-glucose 4,6-dehydratase
LIPKTIGSLLANKPIELYGSGAQIRDWMHVFDVCDAIFKVIEEGEANSIYNISAGQEFSNVDIFQIICKTLNGDYNLLKFVDDRIGHDFRYSMDSSKLKELGWKPTIKFRDGIVQVCQCYLNNKFFLEQGNHDNNK